MRAQPITQEQFNILNEYWKGMTNMEWLLLGAKNCEWIETPEICQE